MALSYYVYYHVASQSVTPAVLRIRELLDRVKTATGVSGRLMKKRGEPNLWMEVYENIGDSAKFEWTLENAVKEVDAIQFLVTGTARHLECFEE